MKNLIEACRAIARMAGVIQDNGYCQPASCAGQVVSGKQFVYFDEKMVIFAGDNNLSLEVVIRRGVTKSGIENPAIMVDMDGVVFRTHGEVRCIHDNISKVLIELVKKEL